MPHPTTNDLLPQDWDRLSRKELIKIILQQQLRLKTLHAALPRLEEQQAGEETTSPHQRSRGPVNYLLSSEPRSWQSEEISSYLPSSHSLLPPLCAEIMVELGLQQELKRLIDLLLTEQPTKMERAIRKALRSLLIKELTVFDCYCNKGVRP